MKLYSKHHIVISSIITGAAAALAAVAVCLPIAKKSAAQKEVVENISESGPLIIDNSAIENTSRFSWRPTPRPFK